MELYEQLESELASYLTSIGNGRQVLPSEVVACSSGTAALHLALESLCLPPKSEVIVPTFTMVACARAVVLAGLTPVFVDCNDELGISEPLLHDYGMDDKNNVHGMVSGIMPVHVYGRRAGMGMVMMFADDYGVRVIEDMAELHGVAPHPGTDAACWSFYQNKVIAGEEGGAVAFRGRDNASLARSLRSLGFTDAHDFNHIPRGHNYRLANCLAEKILRSLRDIDQYMKKWLDGAGGDVLQVSRLTPMMARREIEKAYDDVCPDEWRMPPRLSPWVYDLRVPSMTVGQQNSVVAVLKANGIPARHAFKPMHTMEEFRGCRRIGGEVAERMSREVIYLPIRPGSDDDSRAREAFDLINRTLTS